MHRLFVRAAFRGHWRALVLLGVLVAVAAAAVVATLQAAERSETAFTRLRSATAATDLGVFVEDAVTLEEAAADVRAVDGVIAAEAQPEMFVRPAGTDLYPSYTLIARAPTAPDGRRNVPIVVAGRRPASDRAGEVALSERLAADLGVGVGDDLPLESMTDAWVEEAFTGGDPGPADGPRVRARVVGIVRSPAGYGRVLGVLHLSPAFVSRYADAIQTYPRVEAVVDLERTGPFRDAFADAFEPSVYGDDGATDDGLATIATALRLVAAVAAIAGATTVVMALGRSTRAALRERTALVAIGATRRQLIGAALIVVFPAVAVGALLGVVLGVALTPDAMVGLAARIEPAAARTALEWPIVLGVLGGVLVITTATVVAVAARGVRTVAPRVRPPIGLVHLDRPLPVVLGLRQAVAGEPELGGRTSRAALAVGVLGLVGVVAALTVSGSILNLRSDPYLFGSGGTARLIDSGESTEVFDEVMPLLAVDPRVASLSGLHISWGATLEGRDIALLAFDRRRGSLDPSIVEGRMPKGRGEVALGPATLERIGADVGERVVMEGPDGEATYRVVGSILFPEGDFSFDDGTAMTVAGAEPIVGDVHDTGSIHSVLFDWADGVDGAAADRELAKAGIRVFGASGGVEPAGVTNLGQVSELPKYLAAFLGVLALVTLGHALGVSSRRRTREQATLRVLGLTSRAGAAVVAVQAGVVATVALGLGIPLGFLLGNRIWSGIAENAHVVVRTVLPVAWVAVVVVAVVLATVLVAIVPVVRTRRIRPAQALRAE